MAKRKRRVPPTTAAGYGRRRVRELQARRTSEEAAAAAFLAETLARAVAIVDALECNDGRTALAIAEQLERELLLCLQELVRQAA